MFFVVVIIEDGRNICIPASWIFILDIVTSHNYGLNSNKTKRIFYSKDFDKTPNFLLPLRRLFDPEEDACYLVKVKKSFKTKQEGLAYLENRRGALPPIYNESRRRYENSPIVEGEIEINQEADRQKHIKIEVKNELDKVLMPLRKSIAMFNRMLPAVCDLTEDSSDTIDLTTSDDSGMSFLPDENPVVNEVSELNPLNVMQLIKICEHREMQKKAIRRK